MDAKLDMHATHRSSRRTVRHVRRAIPVAVLAAGLLAAACAPGRIGRGLPGPAPDRSGEERVRVFELAPGVTATVVAPAQLDASQRVDLILYALPNGNSTADTLGAFARYRAPQVELLLHPNAENRILHTAMIGDMNGYMHALLTGRPAYDRTVAVLQPVRMYERYVAGAVTLPPAVPPDIPARDPHALTGSAFIASVANLSRDDREAAIRRELFAGNVPRFLRALRTVEATAVGADSSRHTVAYEVMPDYLAIAPVHVEPQPLTQDRDAPATFLQHHRIIEEQLAGTERGALVAGIKKDVVVTNKLLERPNRVAIYGWHYLNGQPIQPVYAGHVDWYVDYSHGIRPVRRWMRVDGVRRSFAAILADSTRRHLLSDEGALAVLRY